MRVAEGAGTPNQRFVSVVRGAPHERCVDVSIETEATPGWLMAVRALGEAPTLSKLQSANSI
jgi:hypothetical protein